MAYADDMARLERRRRLAEALLQQGTQPQGVQAGRFYVGPTALSTLGQLGSIAGGAMLDRRVEKEQKAATAAERKRLSDALRGIMGGADPTAVPGQPNGLSEASGPPTPERAIAPSDPRREAALSVLRDMPLESQQQLVGQQAISSLFPKPPKLTQVDRGNDIAMIDEKGNVVQTMPKGAAPQGETTNRRDYLSAYPKDDYPGGFGKWLLDDKRAGASSTMVNTGKSFYEGLGDERSKAVSTLYDQATKAPDLLNRARRVKELVGPGSAAITGAGAEWLLAGAKVANQLGFNTGDAAADTEALSRDLAASTLDQIKASGLGAGSGFSNADRDFLEKVVGGKITLEGKTLARLADLNEKSALATIEKWNAQASRLDRGELAKMGMSAIEMPSGTPPPSSTPKLTKNPDGSWTYNP